MHRSRLSAILGIACVACSPTPEAGVAAGALSGQAGSGAPMVEAVEVVLDARADGAEIAGRMEPVREGTDAERILALEGRDPQVDGRVLDARFVPGGVVSIGADHVLRFTPDGGASRVLDEEAWGPLSIAGTTVAYTRGAPPDLELARVSLEGGAAEVLTEGMAPVWSPALSADGSEILFVSAIEGTPRFFRLTRGGATEPLPTTTRHPSAPTAPRWIGSTLVFEDELGIAWLDVERAEIVRELAGARGLTARPDGALEATMNGQRIALPGGAS